MTTTLGEVGTTPTDLMKAAKPFFLALYGQQLDISTESARFTLFTKKKVKVKVMALPPTSENLLLHVLRAHLQVMLWKAVNLPAPPDESADITHFGWEIRDDIPVPVIAQGDPAPPELIDILRCQCRAHGRKCSTEACGCHKEHVSCTTYCNCASKEECCNPYTVRAGNDESVETEDTGEAFEQCLDQEGENNEEEDVPEYVEDEWN